MTETICGLHILIHSTIVGAIQALPCLAWLIICLVKDEHDSIFGSIPTAVFLGVLIIVGGLVIFGSLRRQKWALVPYLIVCVLYIIIGFIMVIYFIVSDVYVALVADEHMKQMYDTKAIIFMVVSTTIAIICEILFVWSWIVVSRAFSYIRHEQHKQEKKKIPNEELIKFV